ncbi:AMP-dependent synthetase and ligase [Sulfitobacter noctilucicola]|uniref:Acyl-CoA synthetase (AMP-forming)/AMP-acid ligase II n=1 Tax=Sulfitobacter noctilucicola TaxID=1342301 RepID=A0A7W6Q5V9_9RHOB|nr:AMP-binding protein [Sulfitobacter noctilucicola]KIN70219.1 AMP-dependent synthetase and ligase [Sulfitobacter noctilucicola]MBB4176123.1 acyl-CoA synthetase (AMP-forming)/AMP-acid ligase II [Sulfitobacter noctilucicola]
MTAMTPEAAVQHVVSTNPTFAVHNITVRGVSIKAFKNIPGTVPGLLAAGWAQHGDGQLEYIAYENESWTYAEFTASVYRLGHALRDDLGMKSGDRIAIAMRNYPELLMLVLAVSSIGGVVVFVNAWWTTEELDYALRDSEAKVVFADGARMERLQPLKETLGLTLIGVRDGEGQTALDLSTLRDGAASDTAPDVTIDTDGDFAVMYSSGTTGHPKGVVQTHRGAVNAVFSWLMQSVIAPLIDPPAPDAPAAPRPSALVVTPLFHVTATHPLFLLSLPAGAKITLMHKWDAEEAVRLIRDNSITRFLGVPTQSAELMEAAKRMGEGLPTMDYLGSGGAKRPAAQVAQLAEAFPNAGVATGWGMTETNALGIGMIGDDYKARPECAGKLHPPVQELRMLDDHGNDVPNGTIGEIAVKGPQVMRCYLNKPDATAETVVDGWLRTGDLGVLDDEGYVTILDRKKNIIIRGGENIACLDVEGALHRHPDVLEAAAFSVPDDRLGEIVGAAVQLRDGTRLTQQDMAAFLDGHLAKFKIPVHLWVQHDVLTRGTTDKIDRRAIRTACLDNQEAQV